jgi:hypothetical protein
MTTKIRRLAALTALTVAALISQGADAAASAYVDSTINSSSTVPGISSTVNWTPSAFKVSNYDTNPSQGDNTVQSFVQTQLGFSTLTQLGKCDEPGSCTLDP